jgi:hypothetical protein
MNKEHTACSAMSLHQSRAKKGEGPRALTLMLLYSYLCPSSVTIILIVSTTSFLLDLKLWCSHWPNTSKRNKVTSAVKKGLPVLDVWAHHNFSRYIYCTAQVVFNTNCFFVLEKSTWQVPLPARKKKRVSESLKVLLRSILLNLGINRSIFTLFHPNKCLIIISHRL